MQSREASVLADRLKAYQALARFLAENRLGPLFGLVGDANLYMVDSFVREYGGSYYSATNEAGATLMALGYATVSSRVGFATVTHGPAVTNTLTALVEGVKSLTPMVLLCGDTAAHDLGNLQDIAQREAILSTGAGFEQMRSAATAVDDLARAIRRARAERRPVAFNIPTDMQRQEVEYRPVPFEQSAPAMLAAPTGDALDDAVGIIAAARRPIVLAGRGASDERSGEALLRLAARIEAPLATTLRGKDLFRGAEYNLGIFGTLSAPGAVDAILRSDCLIAFGAGLNVYTTSNGSLLEGKRVVQVSAEPGDIGRWRAPDAGLVGTTPEVVDTMIRLLDEAEISGSGFRQELPVSGLDVRPAPTPTGGGTGLDFIAVLNRLNEILPTNRVLVVDAGRFCVKTFAHLNVEAPRYFMQTTSFGSIGLGMGAAIGASVAEPERPVVLVVGDGGFMLGGLMEFNSAVRNRSNLIVVLCNDGSYGAEHVQLRDKQMDPSLVMFDWPEFAPLAEALGGRGIAVRSMEELERAAGEIARRDRPLLIDIKLDPDRMPFH